MGDEEETGKSGMKITPCKPEEPSEESDPTEPYHIGNWDRTYATDEKLKKWASDPLCIERAICAELLAIRENHPETRRVPVVGSTATVAVKVDTFDPRTDVSADAKHIADKIVYHLWIIFVLLPIVLGVVWILLSHR